MKTFTILFTVVALALIAFNATKINFEALFEGESIVAIITIFALLCGIILLQILKFSKRVSEQLKNKN